MSSLVPSYSLWGNFSDNSTLSNSYANNSGVLNNGLQNQSLTSSSLFNPINYPYGSYGNVNGLPTSPLDTLALSSTLPVTSNSLYGRQPGYSSVSGTGMVFPTENPLPNPLAAPLPSNKDNPWHDETAQFTHDFSQTIGHNPQAALQMLTVSLDNLGDQFNTSASN